MTDVHHIESLFYLTAFVRSQGWNIFKRPVWNHDAHIMWLLGTFTMDDVHLMLCGIYLFFSFLGFITFVDLITFSLLLFQCCIMHLFQFCFLKCTKEDVSCYMCTLKWYDCIFLKNVCAPVNQILAANLLH